VKQHLAAIRMLFDWLVTSQVVATSPAHAVRGPKHVVKTGKTTVLTGEQARELLDSIDTSTLVGLRDRALISAMTFAFARIGAVVAASYVAAIESPANFKRARALRATSHCASVSKAALQGTSPTLAGPCDIAAVIKTRINFIYVASPFPTDLQRTPAASTDQTNRRCFHLPGRRRRQTLSQIIAVSL
jgi:hypothetical protein